MQITVKGSWLAACGFGTEDKVFEVATDRKTVWTPGDERIFPVVHNGRDWMVAEWHCQPIKKEL